MLSSTSVLNGNATANNNLGVGGNFNVTGTSVLTGNTTVNSNLGVGGNFNVTGTTLLSSTSVLNGNATANNNLGVGGNFNVTGTTTLTGHVTVEGVTSTGSTGTGNFVFSASPTITGTLTGATGSFSGNVTDNNNRVVTSVSPSGSNHISIVASPTTTGPAASFTVTSDGTNANTGGTLVARDSSGNFSAGTITAGIVTTNISTGAEANPGTITGQWTLLGSSTLQATYADLAEWYSADAEYEPGTVLIFGGDAEVTTSTIANDSRVAGVVTTDPAYVMNAEQKGTRACIALQGRVPVKVIGVVKKGDLLTTSLTPGYACKAMNPQVGTIIGKALENKDTPDVGVIQVAIGRN